jgi:type IV secretion system protein VirB10
MSVLVPTLAAQTERDFAGTWLLSKPLSDLRDLPRPAAEKMQIQQDAAAMKVDADGFQLTYALDGKPTKTRLGEENYNIVTKWEGSALLTTIIVAGPDYSIQERWAKSSDGYRLTVSRNVIRGGKENESELVYLTPNAPPQSAVAVIGNRPAASRQGLVVRPPIDAAPAPVAAVVPPQEYLVKSGTRLLLRLTNDVNTKRTVVGDRLYLETAAPLFGEGKLIIPIGTYVTALVTEAHQAGRVKGKSSLNVRFDSLTLPNGVSRNFDGRIATANVDGKLDKEEGRIEGDGGKSKDAKTVAKTGAATTGVGSIIGSAAGHAGAGAAVGAAAGAAGALAGVLMTRGPEVVLPKGTTMEIELDRDLHFSAAELAQR